MPKVGPAGSSRTFKDVIWGLVSGVRRLDPVLKDQLSDHRFLGLHMSSLQQHRLVTRLTLTLGCEGGEFEERLCRLDRHLEQVSLHFLCVETNADERRGAWLYVRAIYAVLVAWVLPASRQTARYTPRLQQSVLWASNLAGLLFIVSHQSNGEVLKVSRGLLPAVQRHLLGVAPAPDEVAAWVRLCYDQIRLPLQQTSRARGLSYGMFSAYMSYWGFAAERRERQQGYTGRGLEHLTLLHQNCIGSYSATRPLEKRYRAFGDLTVHAVYIIPLMSGLLQKCRK